jgi:hypothetical protein
MSGRSFDLGPNTAKDAGFTILIGIKMLTQLKQAAHDLGLRRGNWRMTAVVVIVVLSGTVLAVLRSTGNSATQTTAQPITSPQVDPPPASPAPASHEAGQRHIREMYRAEYDVCWGITIASIGRDYGFSTAGMTPNEVILKMEQESYYPQDQAITYEACLDAYYKRAPKYGPPIRG